MLGVQVKRAMRCWLVRGSAVGALFLSSCGDDELACGDGTVEMDGACVPASMVTCAPGTVLVDGRCVFDADNCAEGTSFDEASGGCVADVTECAPGTVAMGSTCVPDGSVICADNTTFDPDTGTCVVTSEACAEGTTLVDGVCVPDDETLVAEVQAAPEPDDSIFQRGTPGSFVPPGIGEERTLDGCITPADFDGDGELDVDLDVFEFTVDGPGLYRIRADGLRGLAAAFAVVTKEPLADGSLAIQDGFGLRGFYRMGVNLVGDTSERRVFLPGAGTYEVAVFDARSLDLERIASGIQNLSLPVGSEDTCYFVTIEREPLPEATEVTVGEPFGGETGDPMFFRASAAERTVFRLGDGLPRETPGGLDIFELGVFFGQVIVVGDTFTATRGYGERTYSPIVPAGDEALVVIDSEIYLSFDSVGISLSLETVPRVPEDGVLAAVQPTDELSAIFGIGSIAWFEATAGDVVRVAFETDGFPVRLATTEPFRPFPIGSPCTAFPPFSGCAADDLYYVPSQSGVQLIDVFNGNVDPGDSFDVTISRNAWTPVSLTAAVAQTVPLVDERTFVDIEPAPASPWTVVELSNFTGVAFTSADVGFHLDEGADGLADPPALRREGVTAAVGLIQGRGGSRQVLVELGDPAGFDGDEGVDVRFAEETFVDLRVDPTAPAERSGEPVPTGGEAAYYFIRAVPGGEVTFEASGTSGTDPLVEQLDEVTGVVDFADLTGPDGTETLTATVGDPGWLAFAVRAGEPGGTVDVSVTQAPLPSFTYTQQPGETAFTSVCPGAGGDGVVIASGPRTLAARSLSTLTGFTLFGDPVTELRVSTNGWLTTDPSYAGGAFLSDFGFDRPLPPVSVIAPLLNNDIDATVCVAEASDQLVVEWRGSADGAVVETQVVLRADDDTIEVIYGDDHEAAADVVGLKSPDGLTRVRSVRGVDAGTSTVFTPLP
jgi:hypothetical protein